MLVWSRCELECFCSSPVDLHVGVKTCNRRTTFISGTKPTILIRLTPAHVIVDLIHKRAPRHNEIGNRTMTETGILFVFILGALYDRYCSA